MVWAASTVIGLGGLALGAYNASQGSNAAGQAAGAQANAANQSAALQKEMFDKQVELQAPFRAGGLAGQNRIMELLGLGGNANAADFGKYARDFGMADFQQDPGYTFRLQQGQQAIERSAAARGGLGGGRMAKDLTNYAQGAASQEFGNAFNRFQTNRSNQLNPLQSLAGLGQTATGQMQTAAQNYGTNAGNAVMAAGRSNASGYMGQANAISGGLEGGLNFYQNQNRANRLFPPEYVPPIQDNGYSYGVGSAYGGNRAGM